MHLIRNMCTLSRNKTRVLSLYRMLIRESRKFPAYNFRMYALRRVRENFQENRTLKDPEEIAQKIRYGEESLQLIRRQVIIGHLYGCDKIAVEN